VASGRLAKTITVLARIASAHLLARVESYLFDYLFYPYMLFAGGPALVHALLGFGLPIGSGYWLGFAILVALSAFLNVAYVLVYDRLHTDWFGFVAANAWLERPGRWAQSSTLYAMARLGAFVGLSVWESPLFAALWLRRQASAYVTDISGWAILGLAVLAANVGWTVIVSGAVLAIDAAAHALRTGR